MTAALTKVVFLRVNSKLQQVFFVCYDKTLVASVLQSTYLCVRCWQFDNKTKVTTSFCVLCSCISSGRRNPHLEGLSAPPQLCFITKKKRHFHPVSTVPPFVGNDPGMSAQLFDAASMTALRARARAPRQMRATVSLCSPVSQLCTNTLTSTSVQGAAGKN